MAQAQSPVKTKKPAPAKPKKTTARSATTKIAKAAPKPAKATKVAKPVAKAPKVMKPKTAAKGPTGTNGKTGSQTTKLKAPKAARAGITPAQVGSFAAPVITSPIGGSVTAGVDLPVTVTTNQPSLQYDIILQDLTTEPTPAPITFKSAKPAGNPFTVTIPGADLVSGIEYSIKVMVDPSSGTTPPNGTASVTVTAS